jgi:hypothetical protein
VDIQLTTSVAVVLCWVLFAVPAMEMTYVPGGVPLVPEVVLRVRVEAAEPPAGEMFPGEKEHLAPAGSPEQDRATLLLYVPPSAVTVTV